VFISDILRNELGFSGVVITDDLHMEAITKHYSVGDAAIKAVQAGADMVLICHSLDEQKQAINALVHAVKTGQISEERINESIKRIAMLKRHYDLTDEPSSIAAVLSEVEQRNMRTSQKRQAWLRRERRWVNSIYFITKMELIYSRGA